MTIFNLHSDEWGRREDRPGWRSKRANVGRSVGGELIGASLYELDPGERLWPYHTPARSAREAPQRADHARPAWAGRGVLGRRGLTLPILPGHERAPLPHPQLHRSRGQRTSAVTDRTERERRW